MSQMWRRILPFLDICVLNRTVCAFLFGMHFLWTRNLQLNIPLFQINVYNGLNHLLDFCILYVYWKLVGILKLISLDPFQIGNRYPPDL